MTKKTQRRYKVSYRAGATYYLGSLSPEVKRVAFYELDRDNNTARAGVGHDEPGARTFTWFDTPPEIKRLDEPAVMDIERRTYVPG